MNFLLNHKLFIVGSWNWAIHHIVMHYFLIGKIVYLIYCGPVFFTCISIWWWDFDSMKILYFENWFFFFFFYVLGSLFILLFLKREKKNPKNDFLFEKISLQTNNMFRGLITYEKGTKIYDNTFLSLYTYDL